ncbi:hypothetical protein [Leisingera sp.]|uniref:hypothetical protein n=1 Tax=Leisingera sp. TaxID=1879318 RepID=UPI002B26AAF4|nr:hypothetical protein [Leisingera sp.]
MVEFEMKTVDKEIEVDQSADPQGMTFKTSMPVPMMMLHEGNYVELTLINPPENMLQHNIDFNTAAGADAASGSATSLLSAMPNGEGYQKDASGRAGAPSLEIKRPGCSAPLQAHAHQSSWR